MTRIYVFKILGILALSLSMSWAHAKTVVHLFEWSWNDIAKECEDFLGPQGYSAVQVSPPYEHKIGNEWWVRYQPVKHVLSQSRSGSAEEFKSMVKRCEKVGVDIYVDAVINHVARASIPGVPGTGTAGSIFNAATLEYPLFSAADFHKPECHIQQSDYGNNANNVRLCMLANLPDLDTSADYVQSVLANYLNQFIDIGVKGFRIDAAKHMTPEDLAGIYSRLNSRDIYLYHEVIDNGGESISASEYTGLGSITEFKFSGAVSDRFLNGGIADLKQMPEWGLLPSDKALIFTDNHDNQRGHGSGGNIVTFKKPQMYKLANIFMLSWPYGTPRVMSSYAFDNTDQGPPSAPVHSNGTVNCGLGEWECEHRWPVIANMMKFNNATRDAMTLTNWWQDGANRIAFGRGNKGFVVINRTDNPLQTTLQTAMPPGEYCDIVQGADCNKTIIVDNNGRINVNVPPYQASALYDAKEVHKAPKSIAIIKADRTRVRVGEPVGLDGSDSFSPFGKILLWLWPNGFTFSPTTTITFEQPGIYPVTLKTVDLTAHIAEANPVIITVDGNFTKNFPSLFYRGTSNSWSTTPMFLLGEHTWATDLILTGEGDSAAGQRFKVDVLGDWQKNYGYNPAEPETLTFDGGDIFTDKVGAYRLTVNEKTLKWSLTPLCSNDNTASNLC